MKRALSSLLVLLFLLACGPPQAANAVDLQLTSRNVTLSGELSLAMVAKAADRLIELDTISPDPIYLKVNAHGDSVEAAFALVDTVRSLRSPVFAVVQSRAYDMGAVVALLCQKTYVYPHAVLYLRRVEKVSTEVKPPAEPDEAFVGRFTQSVHQAVADALGMPLKRYEERIKDGWWLTATEAVAEGLADAVVESIRFQPIYVEKTEIKRTETTVLQEELGPDGRVIQIETPSPRRSPRRRR